MTRKNFIERCLIQIYGGFPSDDSEITYDLINAWLPDAIGTAAKQNYKENITIDGIEYVNNGFYTTFSGISIVQDDTENICYKFTLPEIPLGIGRNEGISTIKFKDGNGFISLTAIPVSADQWAYYEGLPSIPNKIIYLPEGGIIRIKSTLPLFLYKAIVRMISGGDSTNLDSELNIPPEYFPVMVSYIQQQLLLEKGQKQDVNNDGLDMA